MSDFIKGKRNLYLDTKILKNEDSHFLKELVVNNDMKIIKFLCQEGDVKNIAMDAVLTHAISYNNLEVVKHVIDCGYDLREPDESHVMHAADFNNIEILRYMIEKGVNAKGEFNSAFQLLAVHGCLEQLKVFKEIGVSISKEGAEIALRQAIFSYNTPRVEEIGIFIIQEFIGDTDFNQLLTANTLGLGMVKYLHHKGADIHTGREIVFKNAVKNNNVELMEYCINNGTNVNYEDGFALIFAVTTGSLNVVKALVKWGVDVSVDDNAAMVLAGRHQRLDMIKLLYSYGGNIEYALQELDDDCLVEMESFATMAHESTVLKEAISSVKMTAKKSLRV